MNVLFDQFLDRELRTRSKCRTQLRAMYRNATSSERQRIIKLFLEVGTHTDIVWASRVADRNWDVSFEEPLIAAYERDNSKEAALAVIHHASIDYLRNNEASLVMHSRVEYSIRLANDAEFLIRKYGLCIMEELYVMARIGKQLDRSEEVIESEFFSYLFECCRMCVLGWYFDFWDFKYIPGIRNALWSLKKLGYSKILHMYNKMVNKVNELEHLGLCKPIMWWISDNYFPSAHTSFEIDPDAVRSALFDARCNNSIRIDNIEDLDANQTIPSEIKKFLNDLMENE